MDIEKSIQNFDLFYFSPCIFLAAALLNLIWPPGVVDCCFHFSKLETENISTKISVAFSLTLLGNCSRFICNIQSLVYLASYLLFFFFLNISLDMPRKLEIELETWNLISGWGWSGIFFFFSQLGFNSIKHDVHPEWWIIACWFWFVNDILVGCCRPCGVCDFVMCFHWFLQCRMIRIDIRLLISASINV